MTTQTEALKLALEALETLVRLAEHEGWEGFDKQYNAIKAIKEVLAQPEQEPVAWIDEYGNAFPLAAKQYSVVGKHWKPLYTTPPQRKPLTDEQIFVIKHNWITTPFVNHLDFARAIEAAHGIIKE